MSDDHRLQADFHLKRGASPLILSAPHPGTDLPPDIARRLTPEAEDQPDADHAIHALYDFGDEIGATTLTARWSRYVVDLNRPPDDASLYPGQTTTGLVPLETFKGAPLYRAGEAPDAAEIRGRVETYWRPYHAALRAEIDRVVALHGYCLLWDCHSIEAELPRLFDGRLPDLNLGSYEGRATPPALARAVLAAAEGAPFTTVLDGRFKGGFITRHYGDPAARVFALQLELSQDAYLVPGERTPDPGLKARLDPVLRRLIDTFLKEAPRHV
jgi:N-formylglutamate deformylase